MNKDELNSKWAGKVDDKLRAAPPGSPMKTWETSYTKYVHDKLTTVAARPHSFAQAALDAARALLKDYWDSMHKIYEDRDKAHRALEILKREVEYFKKRKEHYRAKWLEQGKALYVRLKELHKAILQLNEQVVHLDAANTALRQDLAGARERNVVLRKALDEQQRRDYPLPKPIPVATYPCACGTVQLRSGERRAIGSVDGCDQHAVNKCHVWVTK